MILARLLSATPQSDGEHWDLSFRWHYDVWHTDLYSQNPAPYQQNPQLNAQIRPPYPWAPFDGLIWTGSDALFPFLDGFNVNVNTANSPTTLDISGATPVNAPPPTGVSAPVCPMQATISSTGGSIKSGSYLIAIACGSRGPVSNFIVAVVPPGITTGTITVSGVVWYQSAATTGGPIVYAGTSSLLMRSLIPPGFAGQWVGSVADTYGNYTTFVISTLGTDGAGMPDPIFNSFLFQAKSIVHGGVWGAVVTARTATGSHWTATFAGAAFTTNQWAGYYLSSYSGGSGIGGHGPLNYLVLSNTSDTLTFASVEAPLVGAVCVMRAKATSITATTIGDANFVNFYGATGLAVNAEIGNLIRVIAGTGANQPPIPIASNTATVFTLAFPWAVTPDATSVYIIEASAWLLSVPTPTIVNSSSWSLGAPLIASLPVPNDLGGAVLIEGITVDVNGNWSVERYAPLREVWVPPTGNTDLGQVAITGLAYTALPSDRVFTFTGGATTGRTLQLLSPPSTQREPIFVINASGGTLVVSPATGDTIEGNGLLTILPGFRYTVMPDA